MKGLEGFSPRSLTRAIESRESAEKSLAAEMTRNTTQIDEFFRTIRFLRSLNKDHKASLQAIRLHLAYMKMFESRDSREAMLEEANTLALVKNLFPLS